jgi:hypothetical protein
MIFFYWLLNQKKYIMFNLLNANNCVHIHVYVHVIYQFEVNLNWCGFNSQHPWYILYLQIWHDVITSDKSFPRIWQSV